MLYYLQDERIQNVLGHLRKKFEGEITHTNLGKRSKNCQPVCSLELLMLYWFMWKIVHTTYRFDVWMPWFVLANIPTFPFGLSSIYEHCRSKKPWQCL